MRRSLFSAGILLLVFVGASVGSRQAGLWRAMPASQIAEGAIPGGFAEGAVPEGLGAGRVIFEPNRGQTAAGTEFLSRGRGYTLHLRPGEAALALRPAPAEVPQPSKASRELFMRLAGGNLDAEIVGVQPLVGHSNYILGSDPEGWISRVPHFAAVRYRDAYPGIDLVFYGSGGQLEYDFIIGARRDPAAIRFDLVGAENTFIDAEGNLVLQIGGHEIVQSAPRTYQVLGPELHAHQVAGGSPRLQQVLGLGLGLNRNGLASVDAGTSEVEARFVIYSNEESGPSIGFEVGAYDAGLPLVIDPAVGFSTFLGGSDAEEMPHIAVDRQANVYVAGTTASIDFPRVRAASGAGVTHEAGGAAEGGGGAAGSGGPAGSGHGEGPAGGPNAFVTKLSADGSTILYSTYFGGSGDDRANGIVVDSEGNAYVTGQTDSPDFPTRRPLQAELSGPTDAFVAKLSADGAGLIYSSYFGGSGTEAGMGLAIDPQGSIYLTGQTSSVDFSTMGAVQGSLGGASDGFASKISPAGDALIYSTYLGGAVANDGGLSIAVDDAGSAYVTGITESEDFPLVNALQTDFGGGGTDAFVSKLDESGAVLSYSTYLGGSGAEAGLSSAVDSAGQAYVAGQTTSADFPTHRSLQTVLVAGPDAFLSKLAATGEGLVYSTYLGGSGADVAAGVAVDQSSNVHLVGMTSSADFPLADALQPQLGGGADAFVLRLDDLGSELSYSTYLGGAGNDAGVGVALDGAGNALVAGQTGSPDFPLLNATQGAHGGVQDAFVARFCLALIFERNETFPSVGGRGDITVTAPEGCVWPAVSEVEWISVTSGSTGVGSDMVVLEVAANGTGGPRAGSVRVAGKTVLLQQAEARECLYRLTDNSESFYSQGGVGRVRVFTSDDCAWTAVSTVSWISINSGDSGVGEETVSYSVQANRTGRQRAGTLIIAGQVFTVFDWLRDEPQKKRSAR